MSDVRLLQGDSLDVLAEVPDGSVDLVLTDPPYPEIDRPYGRLTEKEWWALVVEGVIPQVRRVLRPTGSAVFVLQPNSRKAGSMRGWLWEFMAWVCREWNLVQDVWWWKFDTMPGEAATTKGTLRQSLKACVWAGPPDCYRDQGAVLWTESQKNLADRLAGRCERCTTPCKQRTGTTAIMQDRGRMVGAAARRGGVTPFNVLPVSNGNSRDSAGAYGHGAGTPEFLCAWWLKYLCPEGGTVLDPFSGVATAGVAALKQGKRYIGIEKMPEHHAAAGRRIEDARAESGLFAGTS